MYISEKVESKIFTGKNNKDAYMKAVKWLSTNIIAVNNSNHITFKIEKLSPKNYESRIKLTLFATEKEEDIKTKHCGICEEVSSCFFMKHNKHLCESCKMPAYRKRMSEILNIHKQYIREKVLK